jgi:hypothetical protein
MSHQGGAKNTRGNDMTTQVESLVTVTGDVYEIKVLAGQDVSREIGSVCLTSERGNLVNASTGEVLHVLGWSDLVGWGELSGESTRAKFGDGPEIDFPRSALLWVAEQLGVEIPN